MNANIGVAKAAYFPQISLSGFLGGQSTQLTNLFSGPNGAWNFVPQVSQPIFCSAALQDRKLLAYVRYEGVDTQLNALDADCDFFRRS